MCVSANSSDYEVGLAVRWYGPHGLSSQMRVEAAFQLSVSRAQVAPHPL